MHAVAKLCSAAVVGVTLSGAPVYAQGFDVKVGGGASIPVGSTSDLLTIGPHGVLGFTWVPMGSRGVGVSLDGMFHHVPGDEDALIGQDVNAQVIDGTLDVFYRFPVAAESRLRPYIQAGGGIYNLDVTGNDAPDIDSETKFGLNGGLGVDFQVNPRLGVFVEGRYHQVLIGDDDAFFGSLGEDFKMVPVSAGVRIGFGRS